MNKILTVIGARPQFIKAVVVSEALKKKDITEIILHTGQHYDYNMSELFFKELGIPAPKYNLNETNPVNMKRGICEVIQKEKPDCCMVYGDTNSTLAGALSAHKLGIPVAHIEAGIRSFNRGMIEERNRVRVDRVASLLFCPTQTAVDNLKREDIKGKVYLVGDVMYDTLLRFLPIAQKRSIPQTGRFYLLTIHRAGNTDKKKNLTNIIEAIIEVGISKQTVFPLHPRTKSRLIDYGLYNRVVKHFRVISPVGYLDNLLLMKNAETILTDSGGMQKEAYLLGTPCITLRDDTEWPETTRAFNLLVGANSPKIKRAIQNPFGDGNASGKIADILGAI